MLLMVVILVILGMIMDAFGAVILVTATVATIAYSSGIHPVHFWMVTLVAFELGYLSPPVALNHLLTRQVVGEAEVLAAQQEGGTFYQRHERIIMPLIAMGISLVLVACAAAVLRTEHGGRPAAWLKTTDKKSAALAGRFFQAGDTQASFGPASTMESATSNFLKFSTNCAISSWALPS